MDLCKVQAPNEEDIVVDSKYPVTDIDLIWIKKYKVDGQNVFSYFFIVGNNMVAEKKILRFCTVPKNELEELYYIKNDPLFEDNAINDPHQMLLISNSLKSTYGDPYNIDFTIDKTDKDDYFTFYGYRPATNKDEPKSDKVYAERINFIITKKTYILINLFISRLAISYPIPYIVFRSKEYDNIRIEKLKDIVYNGTAVDIDKNISLSNYKVTTLEDKEYRFNFISIPVDKILRKPIDLKKYYDLYDSYVIILDHIDNTINGKTYILYEDRSEISGELRSIIAFEIDTKKLDENSNISNNFDFIYGKENNNE